MHPFPSEVIRKYSDLIKFREKQTFYPQFYSLHINLLIRCLALKDKSMRGHAKRVALYAIKFAREVGIPENELIHIRRGALLHDIGKIFIPSYILQKREALTKNEYSIMQKHPYYAYKLLLPYKYLQPALNIPYCHHEKWDGSGYPNGLKGKQIPLVARLFTIIDVWDALLSDRLYRPAWGKKMAIEYLYSQSGKAFEPELSKIFLNKFISPWNDFPS